MVLLRIHFCSCPLPLTLEPRVVFVAIRPGVQRVFCGSFDLVRQPRVPHTRRRERASVWCGHGANKQTPLPMPAYLFVAQQPPRTLTHLRRRAWAALGWGTTSGRVAGDSKNAQWQRAAAKRPLSKTSAPAFTAT